MRDFVVTLHSAKMYTVRADRLACLDLESRGLVIDAAPAVGGRGDDAVAIFNRREVVAAVAADHLDSEADVVAADPDADIPF